MKEGRVLVKKTIDDIRRPTDELNKIKHKLITYDPSSIERGSTCMEEDNVQRKRSDGAVEERYRTARTRTRRRAESEDPRVEQQQRGAVVVQGRHGAHQKQRTCTTRTPNTVMTHLCHIYISSSYPPSGQKGKRKESRSKK